MVYQLQIKISSCWSCEFWVKWELFKGLVYVILLSFHIPVNWFIQSFLFFLLDQIFGAIECDEAIGFPVGGNSQNINVSEGQNTLHKITLCPLKALVKVMTLLICSWITFFLLLAFQSDVINWLRKQDFSFTRVGVFIGLFDLMTDKLYSNQKKNYLVFWMMSLFHKPHVNYRQHMLQSKDSLQVFVC